MTTDGFRSHLGQDKLFVYSCMQFDLGLCGVQNIASSLGLPSMGSSAYLRYKTRVEEITKQKYMKMNDKVVEAIFDYYKEGLDIVPDSDGFLCIKIIFDWTWMTRGHSSLVGAGAAIEAHTRFAIDEYA